MSNQQPGEICGDEFVKQQIAVATSGMLPTATGHVYRSAWHDLQDFRTNHGCSGPTTPSELFAFLANKHAAKEWVSPGTLWTKYSMLKTMMRIREGPVIDDGTITACEAWLKGLSRVHNPKQSLQLTKEQVACYLIKEANTAPIDLRVLLIFGINLGLRTADLKKLKWTSIIQTAIGLRVTVDWATKTDQGAKGNWYFIAREENPLVCGVALFAEYRSIVQEADPARLNGELWLKVIKKKNGKWIIMEARGRNWITGVPSIVAKSLGLPNPEQYTGHCFRRTSAQWQADAGATVLELQNQFGWKNSTMAAVYTGQSVAARAASSRRCLLSADIPQGEVASTSCHQETLQQNGCRQEGTNIEANSWQQQLPAPIADKLAQWPVSISGQTVNIYFGGPPPTGTAAQAPAAFSTPLPMPQHEPPSSCQDASSLAVAENEKDVLSDFDNWDSIISNEDEEQFPATAGSEKEQSTQIVLKAAALSIAKKTKTATKATTGKPATGCVSRDKMPVGEEPIIGDKRGKTAVGKATAVKRLPLKKQSANKPKAKTAIKKLIVAAASEPQASVPPKEVSTGEGRSRPTRTQKIIVHNNPYSRNTKGYQPPQ